MAHYKSIVPKIIIFLLLGAFAEAEANDLHPCEFPVLYNLGDSNSDTNNGLPVNANLPQNSTGKPTRIFSDGRLIVDFIAEKLEKPHLSAYMDQVGRNFSHGVNFAIGGSTINYQNVNYHTNITVIPYPFLASQLSQFYLYKRQTNPLLNRKNRTTPAKAEDFPRALYTIDIDQNDVTRSMFGGNFEMVPYIVYEFAIGLKKLYDEGARFFWVHNTGPQGCLSGLFGGHSISVSGEVDEIGCLKVYNDVAKVFNKKLKEKVVELRVELKEAAITYVDVYPVKYNLFKNAKDLGFPDPFAICKYGSVKCEDPSKYILWDGVHFTEAANSLVAEAILDGAYSDPPIAITQACNRI